MNNEPLHILIVDDESMVHMVTELSLRGMKYLDHEVVIHNAYSASEAVQFLQDFQGCVAVVLLDIVMETLTAGLDSIPQIRTSIAGCDARIIIRTGQAGRNAVHDVVREHCVHGYHDKIALTHDTLIDTVIIAARNYLDIREAYENGRTSASSTDCVREGV